MRLLLAWGIGGTLGCRVSNPVSTGGAKAHQIRKVLQERLPVKVLIAVSISQRDCRIMGAQQRRMAQRLVSTCIALPSCSNTRNSKNAMAMAGQLDLALGDIALRGIWKSDNATIDMYD